MATKHLHNKLKRTLKHHPLLLVYVMILLVGILASTFVLRSRITLNNKAVEQPAAVTLLKGGERIGVVSFNLDKDVDMNGKGDVGGAKPLKDMLSESLAEGKKWDIVGFQEMKETHPEKPRNEKDTEDFIRMMQELGQGPYQCEKQKEFSDDFFSVICSKYPIVAGSYREKVLWRPGGGSGARQARVVQCVQIDSPAGILIVCNTHPRAYPNSDGSQMVQQFRELETFVLGEVLPSYIPETVLAESRDTYLNSLKARILLTGDMNIDAHRIAGKFKSACTGKWLGQNAPQDTGCGIDQVMFVDMSRSEFAHQAPFLTQYLESEGGYKDTTRAWPTDHGGPVVSIISTRELTIPVNYVMSPTTTPSGTTPYLVGKLNVLTFNVLKGHATFCETSGNQGDMRTNATVAYLVENAVDIAFFQEAECMTKLAQAWQNKLNITDSSARIYYARVQYLWAFDKQIAILSRHPLKNPPVRADDVINKGIPLEVTGDVYKYLESDEHRRILNVVADYKGVSVRLIGIHPSPKGCDQLNNDVKKYVTPLNDTPIILAGDYNCGTSVFAQNEIPWITNQYAITCNVDNFKQDERCGRSTKAEDIFKPWEPNNWPIDHIAVQKNEINATRLSLTDRFKVVREQSLIYSDHYPVFAEIEVFSSSSNNTPTPTSATPQPTHPLSITPTTTQTPVPTVSLTVVPTVTPSPTRSPTPTSVPTPTQTPTPTPPIETVTLHLQVRLQGVSDKGKTTENSLLALVSLVSSQKGERPSDTIRLTKGANGVFSGSVRFERVNIALNYQIHIKAARHLKRVLCGFGTSVNKTETECKTKGITLQKGENVLSFEGVPLRAGDLPPQNGVLDSYDLSFIRNSFGSQDPAALVIGDVNMDGIIDTQDFILVQQSLEAKYDEGME